MSRHASTIGLSLVALTAAAGLLVAGPLTPPAGPILPTYKTLTEVEPRIAVSAANTPGDNDATPSLFKITEPGSYYLAGNVVGVSGKIGIEIAASGVTLDLMGFEVQGVPGSLEGIRATTSSKGLAIRNGSVRLWGASGVQVSLASGAALEGLRSVSNGAYGLTTGSDSVIRDCAAIANVQVGMLVGEASTVEHSTVRSNQSDGLSTSTGCVVRGCAAFINGGAGIVASHYTIVENCSSNNNQGDGIRTFAQTRIIGNVCAVNSGSGIRATLGSNHIEGNFVTGNAISGIRSDTGNSINNFIVRNTAKGNAFNFTLPGVQTIGPIITTTGTITTTNPWANFEM
ncbi:MAG: right-handed parallel beta-helix repeat-containing protein [Phycisphaerae bacterium]|nr:right-handed parallel beta-helix repeat-containing protein [Phycisphaerae bacterium]